jgi:hypothetical protein
VAEPGRRARLRIWWPRGRGGSNPPFRTKEINGLRPLPCHLLNPPPLSALSRRAPEDPSTVCDCPAERIQRGNRSLSPRSRATGDRNPLAPPVFGRSGRDGSAAGPVRAGTRGTRNNRARGRRRRAPRRRHLLLDELHGPDQADRVHGDGGVGVHIWWPAALCGAARFRPASAAVRLPGPAGEAPRCVRRAAAGPPPFAFLRSSGSHYAAPRRPHWQGRCHRTPTAAVAPAFHDKISASPQLG